MIRHQPSEGGGLLGSLMMLPPMARIVTGIIMTVLGAGLAVALWGRGVISGLTILLGVVGFFLAWSGFSSRQSQAKQDAELQSILGRKEEMLQDMVDLKRSGGNPVRYLNEQGVQDAELRAALLEELKQRLARAK